MFYPAISEKWEPNTNRHLARSATFEAAIFKVLLYFLVTSTISCAIPVGGNRTGQARRAYIVNFRPASMIDVERKNDYDHGKAGFKASKKGQIHNADEQKWGRNSETNLHYHNKFFILSFKRNTYFILVLLLLI